MNRYVTALTSLGAVLVAGIASAGTGTRVGDFSLLDQKGYFHQLSYYDDHKAVALLVQANGSKATAKALPAFRELGRLSVV